MDAISFEPERAERIAQHLRTLLPDLGGEPASTEAMLAAMCELDRNWREDGRHLPPMLVHYLQRRSYTKALAFVEGREPEKGSCPPGQQGHA